MAGTTYPSYSELRCVVQQLRRDEDCQATLPTVRFQFPAKGIFRSFMSIQSDRWIREQSKKGMIDPFSEKQVREGVISYGLSSYGYDLRVSDEFKIFTNVNSAV